MISIDPKEQTERENYKLLIGTIIPRPVALVTTMASDGTINAAPFSYFNIVSSQPVLISLAIQRKAGEQKDTAINILKEQAFVVHIVDESLVEKANETAAPLPPNESEVKRANLTTVSSKQIDVPGIQEAKVRMECVLAHHQTFAENGEIGVDLVIGKVVQFHMDESIYEAGKINPNKLAAISRLAGDAYAKLGEIFTIKRPR